MATALATRMLAVGGALVASATGVLLASEILHVRASRRRLGTRGPAHTSEGGVVIVLGFANPGRRINLVNRWRARVAVRCAAGHRDVTIVASGGAVRGTRAEAALLAAYIRERLGWRGPLVQETASRSTWENVANTVPAVEDASWVFYASGSLHAEKAREYLWRQRPDLAARLVRGRDHRWGEMLVVKPIFATVGVWKLRALRRPRRST